MEGSTAAPQLERRAVGLPTAISTVFGLIVATTVLVSVGQGFSASWIFLVALGIGLLAMYMQALSFAELATLMPKAGSMNEYVRAGLGAFEIALTGIVALSLLGFGIIGVLGIGSSDPVGPALPSIGWDWGTLTGLLGLAVFTFVGLEYVCPLAEELESPRRDLPLGMFIGLALVAVPLVLFGLAATRCVPSDQLGDPTALTNMTVAIAMLG